MPSPAVHEPNADLFRDMLLGFHPIGSDDSFLSFLVPTSGQAVALHESEHSIFVGLLKDAVEYQQLTIVGNRYRSHEQQAALSQKTGGTLVLLVREPGNPKDTNAVACLVTQGSGDSSKFKWRHVGYLPKHVAAGLAPHWPETKGLPMVIQATLRDSASVRRSSGNVYLTVINEDYSSYIRARDIGNMF